MKQLPIGVSDFKFLIDQNYYYIDKTLFIKEIIENSSQVLLIPRPRRFGKTLNLSMLKYFLEKTETDTRYLFKDTNIEQYEKFQEFHNQFPVIFLSFKDIKQSNWAKAYEDLTLLISNEFSRYSEILLPTLSDHERKQYQSILQRKASEVVYQKSLFFLSGILQKHYQKNVIVLIDEYDSPIHVAYDAGYYDEIVDFMRSLFSSVLKDNPSLQKGILTGILRVAKESIFSDLNNPEISTILDFEFQDKFGFTTDEVKQLLNDYSSDKNPANGVKLSEIKEWYNGYQFGETIIYNPWSLITCIKKHGVLEPYWLNTSSNLLVKKLLLRADHEVKSKLELLLSNQPITERIDKAVIFQNIENQETALWGLLLFTGYLTYSKKELREGITYCDLVIPNKEIKIIYSDLISSIFERTLPTAKIKHLAHSLASGNIPNFTEILQEFIINSMSVFDLPNNEPEKSYHLFVLGLLSIFQGKYQVKSNRESGFGRYDIMLIPNTINDLGIVIEFKKTLLEDNNNIELAAKRALAQVKQKEYAQELKALGITHVMAIGIAFLGKKISVESEILS